MEKHWGIALELLGLRVAMPALDQADDIAGTYNALTQRITLVDAELCDTESVPLKEDVRAYLEREVLPHVVDVVGGRWGGVTQQMNDIDKDFVKIWVQRALDSAHDGYRRYQSPKGAPLSVPTLRSKALVGELAAILRKLSANDERVFDRSCDDNKAAHGRNEYLFDVASFRVGEVRSALRGDLLEYVKQPLWVVESELSNDSGEVIVDFNKLVLASDCNKLFIGRHSHELEKFADQQLRDVATHCSGRIFVALVPHPETWDRQPPKVAFYQELPGRPA